MRLRSAGSDGAEDVVDLIMCGQKPLRQPVRSKLAEDLLSLTGAVDAKFRSHSLGPTGAVVRVQGQRFDWLDIAT